MHGVDGNFLAVPADLPRASETGARGAASLPIRTRDNGRTPSPTAAEDSPRRPVAKIII
jgi:hypothetical protein